MEYFRTYFTTDASFASNKMKITILLMFIFYTIIGCKVSRFDVFDKASNFDSKMPQNIDLAKPKQTSPFADRRRSRRCGTFGTSPGEFAVQRPGLNGNKGLFPSL